jgi:cytochrome c5
MASRIRFRVALALVVACASAVCFAQSPGEAVYVARCKTCHGAAGTPSPAMVKVLGVRDIADPFVKKMTADEMFVAIKNGMGKMKPLAGISDSQIKDSVIYFRSFIK